MVGKKEIFSRVTFVLWTGQGTCMYVLCGQSREASSCIYITVPQYITKPSCICSININIYVTFQKADELNFLLKKGPRQTKCNNFSCCSPLPTKPPPQPCHCISKNMRLSAFPCVTYAVNSVEVLYVNQLLHSTNRNLACLWGQLIFQVIWIMRTISHSTFTFSAQFFEFVLWISREGSGRPSAQLQLCQGDCPESSVGEALALSTGKIC